jgi:hypothetical protein
MSDLKSVICYNGGAGGDFLKALCLTQFLNHSFFMVEETGMIEFDQHYFKNQCEQCYKNLLNWRTIDLSKIQPVDNTHYYFDWLHDIFPKIYYIDFPDNIVDVVVNTYIHKRYQGNKEEFIESALSRIPDKLQKMIPRSNALVSIERTWIRNQRTWRTNANMHAIKLLDIFDFNKIKEIVPEIIQKDLVDLEYLEQLHSAWTKKNQHLLQAHF